MSLVVFAAALIALALSGNSLEARQGPPDLEALKVQARPVLELPGVVFTDADETTGRVVVGVENLGLVRSVEARLTAVGVPLDVVEIRQTDPILQVVSLREKVRPTVGGIQIYFVRFPFAYLCTLGFNAVLDGVPGFVTNSHCTRTQGGVENTQHFQPEGGSSNLIGTEIADPAYFTGGDCPANRRCRYSDSSFSKLEIPLEQAALGKIARTSGHNNGSLGITGTFNIDAHASGNFAPLGMELNKVGRTTGWTRGTVSQTCVDVNVSQSDITQLCQTIVTSSQAIVGGGDSGSAVFGNPDGSGNVTLYGILWGGNGNGTLFVYSPIAGIQRSSELGTLTTFGSWPPTGSTATPTPTSSSATATPTPANTPTPTPTATNTPVPGGNQVSVSAIDYTTTGGRLSDLHLRITPSLVDNNGNAVSGASVSVTVTNVTTNQSWNFSGNTSTNGTVTFGLNHAPGGTYTTVINTVVASGLTWDGQTPPNGFTK